MSKQKPDDRAARFAGFESIPLRVVVVVGEARCRLARLTELAPGQVIPLERRIGEPFELRAGGVVLGYVEPMAEKDRVAVKLLGIAEDDDATAD